MSRKSLTHITVIFGLLVVSTAAYAQADKADAKKKPVEDKKEAPEADREAPLEDAAEAEQGTPGESEAVMYVTPENTVEACQDQTDNDGDSHVDCDDQDCEIFAVCVPPQETVEEAPPVMLTEPPMLPEKGWQCKDGIDNDENGLTDCHEPACQRYKYCRMTMYERPEPKDKAPGVFFDIGLGIALPNYDIPTAQTRSDYGRVPFDPDLGIMMDVQVGYLFLKWMGAGINLKTAFTFASNQTSYYIDWDQQEYNKYVGTKFWGNLGGFLRFQWPFKRFVPFLNVHVGYSATKYEWRIYDADNSWQEIADYESDAAYFLEGEPDDRSLPEDGSRSRHFLFALEPGFEAYAVKRLFAVGIRLWLPVVATENASYDNLGVLLSFGFTPTWREAPKLKPEYAKSQ